MGLPLVFFGVEDCNNRCNLEKWNISIKDAPTNLDSIELGALDYEQLMNYFEGNANISFKSILIKIRQNVILLRKQFQMAIST